jgi:hypothetical protein
MNKRAYGVVRERSTPVLTAASLDVNLIRRLVYDIPPSQILLPAEGGRVKNILLVPILNGKKRIEVVRVRVHS